jgi:two-component system NtrC family response regulator
VGSILFVDADASSRDAWAAAVMYAGHNVEAVAMSDALLLVSDGGIDLVVIDVRDPRGAVVELARGIQALPDAPPIVLVSGSPEAPEASARIGAAAFVPKPFEPNELATTIDRLLGVRPQVFEDEPTGRTRQFG